MDMAWTPSESQIDRYAYGHCDDLAAAFETLLPGRIEASWDDSTLGHAWFADEDGFGWDIDGRQPNADLIATHVFGVRTHRVFATSADLWDEMGSAPMPQDLRAAAAVARSILGATGQQATTGGGE
jgi:hypothetical protein